MPVLRLGDQIATKLPGVLISQTRTRCATWGRDADHPAAGNGGYSMVVIFEVDVFIKRILLHVHGKLGCYLPVVCVCQ
jgi:hypothetical protein